MHTQLLLRSVNKSFRNPDGEIKVVEDISFGVNKGEIVCLMGPSGCGKSTLLHMIAGLEEVDSGSIQFNNSTVLGPSFDRCLVFQQDSLFPWMTVYENIAFSSNSGFRRRSWSLAECFKAIVNGLKFWVWGENNCSANSFTDNKKILESIGLSANANSKIKNLSGGMKKRVELARAYKLKPSLLLLDEAFGSLDLVTRSMMLKLTEDLWQQTGGAILFVTHDPWEAVALADRVIVLAGRPARITEEVIVRLPRPRQVFRSPSPDEAALVTKLFDLIKCPTKKSKEEWMV